MAPEHASSSFGGDVLIPLSPMDAVMVSYGFAVLYVYPKPMNGGSFDLEKLQRSFRVVVDDDYPIMIGEIHVNKATGRVSVQQSAEARQRGARDLRFDFQSTSSNTAEEVSESLERSYMPTKLQKTETIAIRCTPLSGGGVALGVTVNHTLLDGEGLFTFMRTWAQHYNGVLKSEKLVINHNRYLLFGTGKKAQLPHPNVRIVKPPNGEVVPPSQLPTTTQHTFHLSRDNLEKLKDKATDLKDPQFVSTIDVITALFTVLISRARGHSQDVRITTNVNARRRLSPPLPENYAGNCVFSALSTYTKDELGAEDEDDADIPPQTLAKFARRIRLSILGNTNDVMRDAINFLAEQENLLGVVTCLKYILGTDIMFTSWARMGLYDAELKGTRPCYAGIAKVPFLDGMVVITDTANETSGLDVQVFLECSAMDKLKTLFSKIYFQG